MTKVLFVGGTYDNVCGKASGLVKNMYLELLKDKDFVITYFNGGTVESLHNTILPSVTEYQIIFWLANVSNDEIKLRDVKSINHKCILVTSKRNDNNKYTFAELISRALAAKANLVIEFAKLNDKFNTMLFDPLGNVFYNGCDIKELCSKLTLRLKKLCTFTRKPTVQDTENIAPDVPDESEFFSFAHNCADIFHNLIRPAKGTERFLGNMSFRCQNGFPSFRGKDGIVFVSRRNVDKSDINATSFVPAYLDDTDTVRYFGDNKPSVDTPVQLRLYKHFPWANYMLHAHCYIDTVEIACSVDTPNIPSILGLSTNNPIPCGAIEEVQEILDCYAFYESFWKSCHNEDTPRLLAINLAGHGCILIAKDIEILKELQKYKDSCFVQRKMPEPF